jgi:hypothetical protein
MAQEAGAAGGDRVTGEALDAAPEPHKQHPTQLALRRTGATRPHRQYAVSREKYQNRQVERQCARVARANWGGGGARVCVAACVDGPGSACYAGAWLASEFPAALARPCFNLHLPFQVAAHPWLAATHAILLYMCLLPMQHHTPHLVVHLVFSYSCFDLVLPLCIDAFGSASFPSIRAYPCLYTRISTYEPV